MNEQAKKNMNLHIVRKNYFGIAKSTKILNKLCSIWQNISENNNKILNNNQNLSIYDQDKLPRYVQAQIKE